MTGVADKPRFSVRRNAVALTRTQWVVVVVALGVAVAGLVVAFAADTGAGAIVSGVAIVTALLVTAFGRRDTQRRP